MNEFRKDIVSGDWVVISPGRAKRPDEYAHDKPPRDVQPKESCPFEDLKKTGNWPPIIASPSEDNWEAVIIPNKYPAITHEPLCAEADMVGPYEHMQAIGHHDLLVTKGHEKDFPALSHDEAVRVLRLMQDRYFMYAADKCILYASAFQNWGAAAGASLTHPHYQILALPIIPPHVEHSLEGSYKYFSRHWMCAHCAMLRYEREQAVRLIDENEEAVAFVPYASKQPFEVRVFPKKHYSYFEQTPLTALSGVATILQSALSRIKKYLGDPDLNFFIHTSPLKDQKTYTYYHWHIEIIPKITIIGGFELSTGVDINVISPEDAARILRGGEEQHIRP